MLIKQNIFELYKPKCPTFPATVIHTKNRNVQVEDLQVLYDRKSWQRHIKICDYILTAWNICVMVCVH